MEWYAAHAIMYLEYTDGLPQNEYTVWENVFLVEAEDEAKALDKSAILAGSDQDINGEHGTIEQGRPGRWLFAGIRKLVRCIDSPSRPDDGSEITYSTYLVGSAGAARALAAGETLTLEYLE
ncbi:MAG: DUF4288 domain-containing protein [Coriobacteriia bacterium]|nr:DUF4288 domain-containing protein [Coriobacteriia bacterium]